MNNFYSEFVNKYSLSKTLRFELIPQGKTLENIKTKGFLEEDEERAKRYEKVKKIIDEYHKDFIEEVLSAVNLSQEELKELAKAYEGAKNKDENSKKALVDLQNKARKKIAEFFTKQEKFKTLFAKELIKNDLDSWLDEKYAEKEASEKKEVLKDFKTFTTYFTGFHENRKNIYKDKEQSTSIAYRIIHDNFPKYLDNAKKIEILLKEFPDINLKQIERELNDILQDKNLKDFFALENFSAFLSQSGINKYNSIIGGKTLEDGTKLQGINEAVNLYRQSKDHLLKTVAETEAQNLKSEIKKLRSLKLVSLYKQILSDQDSLSFLPEKFEDDKTIIDAINNFYEENIINIKIEESKEPQNLFNELQIILDHLKDADLDKIYIKNDKAITDISQYLFADFDLIKKALEYYVKNELIKAKKQDLSTKKEEESWDKWVNKTSYFSISTLNKALIYYKENLEDGNEDKKKFSDFKTISQYFLNTIKEKINACIENHKKTVSVLNAEYGSNSHDLITDKKIGGRVEFIKNFLDSLQTLLHFLKPLYIAPIKNEDKKAADILEKDSSFYTDFDIYYEKLNDLVPLYNKVRNYLTRKPYSLEKYKLNFKNSLLADGWDQNMESAKTSILFIKNGIYYLGIMDKNHNKSFQNIPSCSDINKPYQKIVYKLLPGANKMLPKVFFSDKNIKDYQPSEELLNNYNNGTHKKGEYFNKAHCHALINFFKESIKNHPDWKHFDFKFSDTDTYSDISQFYREVESQGYKISFENVAETYINTLVDEGKLYLFQIYNKDFSKYSKGKPNLHTLYWKALFDEHNLEDVVFQLNGGAELFYRKLSIKTENRTIHKANKILENKNNLNNKKTSSFPYPLIKDKRFTEDKFSFHVPIKINFKSVNTGRFNDQINKYLKSNPNIRILGIDRGERHLAYYTLIDQKGNIKKQASFNIITDYYQSKEYKKDYQVKLTEAEIARDKARKSWGSIENIKNLKEGYLSQVVHQICKIVIENNAIVIFEDLNQGFKRGRFKFEKQIYQKLEKMLIEKLNYLIFKDRNHNEPGGVLRGYQLTEKFDTYKKMGKQTGIIFYVPAYHTSKICPVTGFVDLLYPKYESIKQSQEFFKKFDSIIYNNTDDCFEFKFNYKNFTSKAGNSQQEWTVCTYGDRLENSRNSEKNNQWDSEEINLTNKINDIFQKNNIQITPNSDLKDIICDQKEAKFFKDLFKYLKLTLQMRNSKTGTDIDYLISPVKNSGGKGKAFDSRNSRNDLPENADANGAYHIGLKGLMVLDKINKCDKDKKPDLHIENSEWYKFAQSLKKARV